MIHHAFDKKPPVVIGTGLIALDLVISANPSSPVQSWAGGTCGNVLTILSYLGWHSFPVGRFNNNSASQRVKNDLLRWGVKLDFAETPPTTSTPIIVQEIIENKEGDCSHKFSWFCPQCGSSLPRYQPVTLNSANDISKRFSDVAVFFFDRVSPAAIALARKCKELGAVIVFEPSVEGDKEELVAAIKLADVIKYSGDRLSSMCHIDKIHSPLLEIKTLGEDGLLYRWHGGETANEWHNLPPIRVTKVKDSCGCGDWTTAGFISKACHEGIKELKVKSLADITEALQYGQLLAAWNCQFEGARGGMYQISSADFDLEVRNFSSNASPDCTPAPGIGADKMCPACKK